MVEPAGQANPRGTGRNVNLPGRKRVAKACDGCRRLKEKCDGSDPCIRCVRSNRPCKFTAPHRHDIRGRHAGLQHHSTERDDFFDKERIKALEQIVQHYTHLDQLTKSLLIEYAASLPHERQASQVQSIATAVDRHGHQATHVTTRPGTSGSFGELSHQKFSLRVQQKVAGELNESIAESVTPSINPSPGVIQLQSKSSLVARAAAHFPPPEVAHFLTKVFFEYAQTNYIYVAKSQLLSKLDAFYSNHPELDTEDAAWVCTILVMFAVGTQFAHLTLSSSYRDTDQSTASEEDDGVALTFYHAACALIPDVITIGTFESVQAFLLLTVFTLPIDAGGLSCTYSGIALRIATQNSMHREERDILVPEEAQARKSIFWTAWTLERRICVFHGRPISLAKNDVQRDYPYFPSITMTAADDETIYPNFLAMIRLTEALENARDAVSIFEQASENCQKEAARMILDLKSHLKEYWNSLPTRTFCRDLDPAKPLFRCNIHLALTYHSVFIFIGRSLIFNIDTPEVRSDAEAYTSEWLEARDELVKDCLQSAIAVVDLCQNLHEEIRLAKSSYTEFTSCCAAILVLIAHRVNTRGRRLQKYCDIGIKLLKEMSVGIFANNSEKLTVDALEAALRRLDEQSVADASSKDDRDKASAYMQFKSWASLQQNECQPVMGSIADVQASHDERISQSPAIAPLEIPALGTSGLIEGVFGPGEHNGSSINVEATFRSYGLEEFASSVPGLDQWFQYGL